MRIFRLAVPALIASAAAFGQNTAVLQFHFPHSTQSMREIATTVKYVADVLADADVAGEGKVSIEGKPDGIKLAEWIFNQLDAAAPGAGEMQEFPATGAENLVRIYYLRNAETVQDFQEIATAVRAVADVRRVYTYSFTRALVVRTNADQMALADWMIGELDRPVSAHSGGVHAYRMTSGFSYGLSDTRIFYLAHAPTVEDIHEVTTAIRSVADIRQVFAYNKPRALVVRGAPEQIALSAWLVDQLDTLNTGGPRESSEVYNYQGVGRDDNTAVRVFYLNHAGDKFDLQRVAYQVRAATNIRRVFTYNSPRALIVRGNTDQVAMAEQLVQKVE